MPVFPEGVGSDRPVVVFGGSFDPPHYGHLIIAQDLFTVLEPSAVLFVPASRAPHKTDRRQTEVNHRLAMTTLAIAGDPRFVLYRGEAERGGVSYTVDTVDAIRDAGCRDVFVAVGADNLPDIPTWKDWRRLSEIAKLVVMNRPGVEPKAPPSLQGRYSEIAVTAIGISSTVIRDRVRTGSPIRYLVPDAVATYIFEHNLCLLYTSPSPRDS